MLAPAELAQLRALPLRPSERNRLRLARSLARITQTTLAARTRMPQARLSRIERGGYSKLPIETARALAAFFGCTIEDLFPRVPRRRGARARRRPTTTAAGAP